MANRIKERTSVFPVLVNHSWHLHIPTSMKFINSPTLPDNVKIRLIQLLIDRAQHLLSMKPHDNKNYRVTVAITLKELWSSQIILYEEREKTYYPSYFSTNDEYHKLIPLILGQKFKFEHYLKLPEQFYILGYKEIFFDDDNKDEIIYDDDLWVILNTI